MGLPLTRESSGTGWPLRDTAELMTALTELTAQGWSGGIETSSGTWKLRLSKDGCNTVNAELGQWIVLDGDLKALSCSEFQSHGYSSDPVVEFPQAEEQVVEMAESTPFGATSPDMVAPAVR